LWIDPAKGFTGDTFIAALIGLGVPEGELGAALGTAGEMLGGTFTRSSIFCPKAHRPIACTLPRRMRVHLWRQIRWRIGWNKR
jgi:hypothetical protein